MWFVLACVFCFAIGALCFYVPLRRLRQKIQSCLPSADSSNADSPLSSVESPLSNADSPLSSVESPLSSVESPLSSVESQLAVYISSLKDRNKSLASQLSFFKQTSFGMATAVQEPVIVLDREGTVLFHNPQSRAIFYLPEPLPEPAPHLNEIVRSPDIISLFEECRRTQTHITAECSFRKKNQHIKSLFQVTALPLPETSASSLSSGSEPLLEPGPSQKGIEPLNKGTENIILVFYDQTDIKESQTAHIDFVSNVSHELKTPLTSLQGYVEMLIQDFKQKNLQQFETFGQILLRNCKRMSDLVNDLLSLSNLISQANMEKQKLSTREVTKKVMKNIKNKDHQFHFVFLADYVTGHPLWVETVLHNLVDNACRHTPKNSDVHIRWESDKNRVLLKVRDTGEGIPEKYQQRVFERFFRIDPARSRAKGGTGVGLSLVKQALEKHGGSVRVVSSPARGAEFICVFPNT